MKKKTKYILPSLLGVFLLIVVALLSAVFLLVRSMESIEIIDADSKPYLARRAALSEDRQNFPSPQHWEDESPPPGVQEIHYSSEGRTLKAWYRAPTRPRTPALVYLHGGFAFGATDYTDLEPFLNDDWAILTPTFRGENGNPGSFEMYLGEVEDAANAIRWIASQPNVDPNRIYLFGHSSGGVIASLISLVPDLPVAMTGSSGGLYPEEMFLNHWSDIAPFNVLSRESRRVRVLHPNIGQMVRGHVAYVAKEDMIFPFSQEIGEVQPKTSLLNIRYTDGDHISSLPTALRLFKEAVDSPQ